MAMESRRSAVLDTSVLVNFLVVGRADLLTTHSVYRFALTRHVRGEVTDFYPEQLDRLNAVLASGGFEEVEVEATNHIFLQLTQSRRLGAGESAAIAHAVTYGLPLAIDDRKARTAAQSVHSAIELENTESLVVLSIRHGALEVNDADTIKHTWETHHRFKLPFGSFAERL